ncbi:MAG: hypothetical protein CR988_00820 [Treponema sp.]|nr:MAG: hypothetical protein CR988_00820 [Treponema sp.]
MDVKLKGIIPAILFIVLGAMLLIHPGSFSQTILFIAGIACLVYAVLKGIKFAKERNTTSIVFAVGLLILAAIFFIKPKFLQNSIGIFLGLILIVVGIFVLKDSFVSTGNTRLINIIIGVLLTVIGLFSIFKPNGITSLLSIAMGIGFIVIGIRELLPVIKK